MVKEPRYLHEYVEKLDFFICLPMAKELLKDMRRNRWFIGGEFEHEYDSSRLVCASAALKRLEKRFGPPNTTLIPAKRNGASQEKPRWEYIFLLNAKYWFSIYEAHGNTRLGFRILAPDDLQYVQRYDFYASDELCEGFIRFIDSMLKKRSVKALS